MIGPAPARDLMTVKGRVTVIWERWFRALEAWSRPIVTTVGNGVSLTAQAAAIATTTLPTPMLKNTVYRITHYIRITQAATTSSSATLTLTWVDGGVTCTSVFAALTGNTTSTNQNGKTVILVDKASVMSYAVAYASVGATPMKFSLTLRVEELP